MEEPLSEIAKLEKDAQNSRLENERNELLTQTKAKVSQQMAALTVEAKQDESPASV